MTQLQQYELLSLAFAPYLLMLGGLLCTMIAVAIHRSHAVAWLGSLTTMLVAWVTAALGLHLAGAGVVHGFNALFLIAAVVTSMLSYSYVEERVRDREEFHLLLLMATFGGMVMAAAAHFAVFLLGLEILSISLYAMIAYPERQHPPLEAAIKYLVLSGVASTSLLFGMALIFAATGSLAFEGATWASASSSRGGQGEVFYLMGQAMIWTGLAFKLSLVPFHMWTPDVYQGAPAPVTGFIATVGKGSVVAMLFHYAIDTGFLRSEFSSEQLVVAISVIAVLSMLAGNFLALLQNSLKRLLAYSSIAHLGYLLIAVILTVEGDSGLAIETILLYLTAYFLMSLVAFGTITVLSLGREDGDMDSLEEYAGLLWRHPVLAAALIAAALSLAGIPLTVGFIAKFYLLYAGIEGALWILVWALVIGSAIGIYYYLRVIFSMVRSVGATRDQRGLPWESVGTIAVMGATLIVFGIYPTPLIDVIGYLVH